MVTHRFNSSIYFNRAAIIGVVCVLLGLAGCAAHPLKGKNGPGQVVLARTAGTDALSERDVLLQRMAAEFALANGDFETATRHYAAAAAVSLDPALAEQATQIALAAKQWRRAQSALTRWQTLAPDQPGMWQARATLLLADDQTDMAYPELARLAQEPNGKGWRLIGQVLLGTSDKAAAGELLERLAKPELLGANEEIWIGVSQLAFKLQNQPLAVALAEQALVKFQSSQAYAWSARLALQEGDARLAKARFAQAFKRDNKNPRLRVEYATLLGDQGENVAAERILAQGPQDDYTYAARAAYAARTNAKTSLNSLYSELRTLTPPYSAARLYLLGQVAELIEHKTEALRWYSQVSDDNEHWLDAQMRVAVLTDESGDTETALTLVHELQTRSGDDAKLQTDVFLLEGELLRRHERSIEALETYQRGLQASPENTRLLYARALLNETLDHLDEAERDLRRVVELKPDDADALNALGYTLADRTDRHEEALALIEKAIRLKPEEPSIIDSLGWAQYRRGHLDEAIVQLRRAYAKQPDPEIAAHLGEVLWVSGQKEEAKKIWEQGRKKDGKNKILLKTIERLES